MDRAHVVEENMEALEQRIRMAEAAEERIILSTFDFREDESTWDYAAALYHAAERGVQIKILVDGVSGLLRMEGHPFFTLCPVIRRLRYGFIISRIQLSRGP